jgi:hypothetical protein
MMNQLEWHFHSKCFGMLFAGDLKRANEPVCHLCPTRIPEMASLPCNFCGPILTPILRGDSLS